MKPKNIYIYLFKIRFPLVVLHLFEIQFPTKNSRAKFFIKMHRFQIIHQKLNSKGFFQPLVVTRLFKIQFSTKKSLAKFFLKMHRFFPTPGGDTFVQISISYKKFPSEIFHKSAWISTYLPQNEFERFFFDP